MVGFHYGERVMIKIVSSVTTNQEVFITHSGGLN